MSYEPVVQPIVLDFETGVIPGAAEFLKPIPPPDRPALNGRLTDPEKIEADKAAKEAKYQALLAEWEQEKAEQANEGSLDIDLARIVCVAWKEPGMPAPLGMIAKNEEEERKLLKALTKRLRADDNGPKTIIGHNVLDFDCLLYQRRCLYLGVTPIKLNVDRYRHSRIVDTMQELSYNGRKKYKGVAFYKKRFGIKVEDEFTGGDISRLIVMQDWAGIVAHCKADVETEYQIAVRCGFIDEPAILGRQPAAPFFDDQPF